MAVMQFCWLRKPRAVYFTHGILAFNASLTALVIPCCRQLRMFSSRHCQLVGPTTKKRRGIE